MDFLTFSCARDLGAELLEWTRPREDGGARPGFARSELRDCYGGTIWRRWEPHQSSKIWGMEYESWEASSGVADIVGGWLDRRSAECRPSRVDVAFDFSCEQDYLPEDLEVRYAAHLTASGIVPGVSGAGGVNTLYVGSSKSDKRIRVYRKDRQSPAFAEIFGPVLRVELVLKKDLAAAWWQAYRKDHELAYAGAAAHVESMTGLRLQDDVRHIPAMEVPIETGIADGYFEFLKQNASRIVLYADQEMQQVELAREYLAANSSRTTEYRQVVRNRELSGAFKPEIIQIVQAMIRRAGARRRLETC